MCPRLLYHVAFLTISRHSRHHMCFRLQSHQLHWPLRSSNPQTWCFNQPRQGLQLQAPVMNTYGHHLRCPLWFNKVAIMAGQLLHPHRRLAEPFNGMQMNKIGDLGHLIFYFLFKRANAKAIAQRKGGG